jgi:hypothetical protein
MSSRVFKGIAEPYPGNATLRCVGQRRRRGRDRRHIAFSFGDSFGEVGDRLARRYPESVIDC